MTVAIGMICSDGVLVASDSMGSTGLIARHVTKVHAFDNRSVIWTRAGSEFIAQRIALPISVWDRRDDNTDPLTIARGIAPSLADAYAEPVSPPGEGSQELKAHAGSALILDWDGMEGRMSLLPSDLAAEDCSNRGFVAIGSGHEYASVVGAAFAHYGDRAALPLAQGCLIAYRVISAVCQVSSWGVGVPVQMAVADGSGARVLLSAEIEEIDTSVQRWLASEHDAFKNSLGDSSGEGALPMPASHEPKAG